MPRSRAVSEVNRAGQFDLRGKVALITGASRGVGRGIAIVLADAGATVYVTGRTVSEGAGREGLPGSITSTAAEIAGRGGTPVAIACDHTVPNRSLSH
ncbi:MAG TPA: SDR family NAD(P)-dependent oxidoreductase [Chloroflexota bacterium]|jgi:NAD(P)-dependent dehydrogenase (short-subunit alcohol dehydrogenase family)|nr:SDR family NAD(P)-dependent oxidoreductase [Chloroflexota bacterium]